MKVQDHPEFEQLIHAYGQELFGYLWRLFSGSEQDAEDCLQETFLKAFQAYHRLHPGSNHRAWLYKIATNTSMTMLRRARRAYSTSWVEEPAGSDPPPDLQAEQRIVLEQVYREVDKLPPKQRHAIILRKYQALSYGEIAEIIGGDVGSARANVYQGIRKLRKIFYTDEGETA